MNCPLLRGKKTGNTHFGLWRDGMRRVQQVAVCGLICLLLHSGSALSAEAGAIATQPDAVELLQLIQQQALQLKWLEVALDISLLLLLMAVLSAWHLYRSRKNTAKESGASPETDNAEYREMVEALKESEARYRDNLTLLQGILESTTEVTMFALDREYRYLAFNAAHRRDAKFLWGTDIELGRNWLEGVHTANTEEHREFCRRGFDRVLAGESFSIESVENVVQKDGTVLVQNFDNFSSPIRNEEGEIVGLTVISVNITERKRLETELLDSRNFLDQVLDAVPDPIFVKDRQHRWILLNDVFCKFIGQPREALLGKSDYDFMPQKEADVFWEKDELVFESGEINLNEESITTTDGRQYFIQTKKTPFTASDGSQMLVGAIRDITNRRQAELKLREALEFSEGVINAIPDLLFEVDREGRYLNVWAHDPSLLAAQKEMLIGKTVHEVFTPENAEAAMAAIREADENDQAHGMTICLELPQGRRWFEHSLGKNIGHATGNPTFLVLSRDVTERVEGERKLQESLEFSEGIINAIPDLLFELDREGRYLNIWTHTPELLAANKDELLNRTVNEALDAQSAATAMAALQEADEHELSFGKIIHLDLPHGPRWFELSVSKMPGDSAAPHFLVLSRDITRLKQTEIALVEHRNELEDRVAERTAALHETNLRLRAEIAERQRAQEELAAREREFRTLAEHLPDNLARYDRHGRILYYNPALETDLGLTTAEVRGMTPIEAHPDWDFSNYQRNLERTLATGSPCEFELPIPDTGNSASFYHILLVAEHEADGMVAGALAIGRDITARKRAERELVLLNHALDESFDAVYLLDIDGNIRYVNKAAVSALGYTYDELLSMTLFDIDPVTTPQHINELANEIISHGRLVATVESQHRRRNGECFPVEIGGTAVQYEGDTLVLTTVRDISERKLVERQLHEQQEALRAALDNAPDAIIRYDRELRRTYFNPIMQRVLERAGIPLLPMETTPVQSSPIIEHGQYIELLQQVLDSGEERQAELAFDTRNETRWVDLRFAPEFDAKGRVASVLVFGRDVTERRAMERRLQESHTQLQELAGHNEIVREEERKNIARELHDDLGQYLTALRLLVSATDIEYGVDGGSLAERLKKMLELIDRTKLSVRNLSQQLRPAVLDMGIFPALKWLIGEFQSHSGIECELTVDDPEINMADRCATTVFRVVQESLTNVSRHSLAHSVVILLKRKDDYHLLEVRDDGMGFEPSEKRIGSFGLVGMRERLLAIGGRLEVISAAEKGTRIIAYIPVHEIGNEDD